MSRTDEILKAANPAATNRACPRRLEKARGQANGSLRATQQHSSTAATQHLFHMKESYDILEGRAR